jgi:hypothetical protein
MDDYMLMRYLRNEDVMDYDEHEMIRKFKEFLKKEGHEKHYHRGMFDSDFYEDPYRMYRKGSKGMSRMYSMDYNEIDEAHAKHIVSEMFHKDNGRKVVGEKFSMSKANEVYNKYIEMLDDKATVEEVYIAINAQYHDYCALFKSWFGNNIDDKIIISAIIFWFKDPDYSKGSKVRNYFE